MYRGSAFPFLYLPVALGLPCFGDPHLPLLLPGTQVKKQNQPAGNCLPLLKQEIRCTELVRLIEKIRV